MLSVVPQMNPEPNKVPSVFGLPFTFVELMLTWSFCYVAGVDVSPLHIWQSVFSRQMWSVWHATNIRTDSWLLSLYQCNWFCEDSFCPQTIETRVWVAYGKSLVYTVAMGGYIKNVLIQISFFWYIDYRIGDKWNISNFSMFCHFF